MRPSTRGTDWRESVESNSIGMTSTFILASLAVILYLSHCRRTGILVFGPQDCKEIEDIKHSLSVNRVPYQVFPGNKVKKP